MIEVKKPDITTRAGFMEAILIKRITRLVQDGWTVVTSSSDDGKHLLGWLKSPGKWIEIVFAYTDVRHALHLIDGADFEFTLRRQQGRRAWMKAGVYRPFGSCTSVNQSKDEREKNCRQSS